MPTYYDPETGEAIKDPVADAKSYLKGTSYLDPDSGEPISKPTEPVKEKAGLARLIEWGDKPLSDFASRHTAKLSEDLMSYGEQNDDLLHKAALYSGGFIRNFAGAADAMTSPTNLALTAATMGASTAETAGFSNTARALATPGKIAGGLMMGHGAAKAINAENNDDRIAGVAEGVLGYFGARDGSVKSSELPKEVPKSEIVAKPKSAFEVVPNSPEKVRLQELANKGDSITSDELKEAASINRKFKSLAKTKEEISKFKTSTDEPVVEQPKSQFTNTKPRVRLALDDEGRTVGYEPITEERPEVHQLEANKAPELETANNPPNAIRKYLDENGELESESVEQPVSQFNNDPSTKKARSMRESANRRAISGNLTDKEYQTAKQLKPGDTVKVGDNEGQFISTAFGKAKIKVGEDIITVPHDENLIRTKRGPQWPEGMPLDQRVKIETKPDVIPNSEDPQLVNDYKSTLQEGEVPSFKRFTEFKNNRDITAKQYLNPETGEPIIESKPTAKYNSFQEDDTHPEGGFHLYDIQGGPSDKSSVAADTLQKMGIEVPETPSSNQIPPEIKSVLDNANIDSSMMSVDQAVNKARQLSGQETTAPNALDKLKNALQKSNEVRPAQEALNANERTVRAGKLYSNNTPGLAGHYERQAMLKGEFPKIPIESQITHDDIGALIDQVKKSDLKAYEIQNAGAGIIKLASGQQVTPYESKILGRVFGQDFEDILHLHGGLGAVGGVKNFLAESLNLGKTMKAAFDLSAPLRQGKALITTPEFWRSFKGMIRNEKDFNALQEAITTRPKAEFGNKAGLYLADVKEGLQNREEQFFSKQIDKVPVIGGIKKGSEYAYVGFLNKLRSDVFDNLIDKAVKAGHEVSTKVKGIDGEVVEVPNKLAKDIASFVNNSTGRGSLGRLEKNAAELNALFFSPRFQTSRLTMLNPKYYKDLDPFVRKQALRSLLAIAGTGIITTELLKKAGAKVTYDPTSSDFMKSRFGNTREDANAGLQQYVVAASRLITGEITSINGKTSKLGTGVMPSRLGLIFGVGNKYNPSLMESKFSPIAGFIDTIASGRTYPTSGLGGVLGSKFDNKITSGDTNARLINQVTPMYIDDLIDLKKEDPDLIPGISLATLALFGDSLQTMDEPKPKSAFRMGSLKP